MNIMRKTAMALAGASLLFAPVAASAAPAAQSLSISKAAPSRAAVNSQDESEANRSGWFIGIGFAVLVVILAMTLGDDDDDSASA